MLIGNRAVLGVVGLFALSILTFVKPAHADAAPAMAFRAEALPPQGYLDFCDRRPEACGTDAALVHDEVLRARTEIAALAAPQAATAAAWTPAAVSPAAIQAAAPAAAPPAMDPSLWALLNRVDRGINRAIAPRTDQEIYGVGDYWAEPLEDGRRDGDCEDYVLEKEHALIAAGFPREDLSIAAVTTSWGESHAVLLVATSQGEFVLDNLNDEVKPWWTVDYRWNKRQLPGRPFQWVTIAAARR